MYNMQLNEKKYIWLILFLTKALRSKAISIVINVSITHVNLSVKFNTVLMALLILSFKASTCNRPTSFKTPYFTIHKVPIRVNGLFCYTTIIFHKQPLFF